MGDFEVELYWKHAPNTCRNFAELVRRGYYNGTKFHRIIKDFMIQGEVSLFFYQLTLDGHSTNLLSISEWPIIVRSPV